jgi:hypothetical protein
MASGLIYILLMDSPMIIRELNNRVSALVTPAIESTASRSFTLQVTPSITI